MDKQIQLQAEKHLPPTPASTPAAEPSWWRLGWVPYVVVVLVAAAADFMFPQVHGFGAAAALGVLLFVGALLLLRRDFTVGEQVFLVSVSLVCAAGLWVNGRVFSWMMASVLPFVLVLLPGKKGGVAGKYLNWWQFWFSHRIRAELSSQAGRIKGILPLLLSLLIGVVCFVFFLCIFATGNPVVAAVWEVIVQAWNSIAGFLHLDWTFCLHALIWGLGALAFGIYTFPRALKREAECVAADAKSRSVLPYLAPCMLVGSNLAFLVATSTDVAFLWLHRVPAGISQTDYLYEGAVSITWASVIAAFLLLALFRHRGSSRRSLWARVAGYALLVQTFVLAISVYMRLYNQVSAYGFTPLRLLAAESMVLGVVALVFLLLYMRCKKSLWSLARPFGATFAWLVLLFVCMPLQYTAGALNMHYAPQNPHWRFSAADFNTRAFSVDADPAFAWYVYQLQPQEDLRKSLYSACQRRVQRAAKKSWRNYNLIGAANDAAAAEILKQLPPPPPES